MVGISAKRLVACFAVLSLAPVARGQQRPSAIALVPAADWRLLSSRTANVETVGQFGGDPAIEREYGVESLEIRRYQLGGATIEAVVEPSPDPTTAFGLLTYYATGAITMTPGQARAVVGPDAALMAHGRYFFRIPRGNGAASKISENDIRALMFMLVRSHPIASQNVNPPDSLPRKGLIAGTEKYLLGPEAARHVLPSFRTDLLGFSQGAEVQMGTYSTEGGGRATVLAITYPTPQMARARYGEMESILELNQERGAGSVYGKRLGSFMIIVLGANSAESAKTLTDAFAISGRIVPNERYPGDKPITIQMMELIVNNLLFAMILAGAAIGGGLLVFVSKRVARKFFPESEWVQADEGILIVLRLS
jgi:hypothetical protein